MRDQLNLPISYNHGRNGLYYNRPVLAFPGQPIATGAEVSAIIVANQLIAQYAGLPLQKLLESGFRKLVARLGGPQAELAASL